MSDNSVVDAERSGTDFWVSALLGAVVSVVTSFVPLSPVLGGGVAGYLHAGSREDGLRVGAVSGAIAAIPVVLLVALVFGGLGFFTIVEDAFRATVFFAGLLFVVTLIVVALSAGLSAVGGYLGVYVREETRDGDGARRRGESVEGNADADTTF
ncbi:DUF5518 domain-containing protein [Halogeometricum luteum]|uniref:DUF5518 domain-containing protein n=1 Tax=Halogeometricum luteum TaxID=2950537 RepID=A0ABU2FZZ0_9EURY|nr:DUF5518 domain-containing protein [Halogeometricum sp. S3BR5-2]MDS0294117.1 DUF5518 domain-containing protein [Halogeometricum sp. S3BR5-2]